MCTHICVYIYIYIHTYTHTYTHILYLSCLVHMRMAVLIAQCPHWKFTSYSLAASFLKLFEKCLIRKHPFRKLVDPLVLP